ncbi:MAG TPA: hypothetical protein PLE59_00725 [Bacteroidales bacterium]|nr:hypothetical protein [Bacteroidales bacterium]HPL02020.1 hypothetical protein [Bacteroidales bacterium]HQJ75661.1 hypothetical protein [Bacteroidota bacterium]HRR19550.1 hypothetical protein [Ignavibacteriales bacterium]
MKETCKYCGIEENLIQRFQFDGDYWHGYTKSEEELLKTECGRAILKIKQKDIEQNKTIKNLIRIREKDFDENTQVIDSLIKKKTITNIINTLY